MDTKLNDDKLKSLFKEAFLEILSEERDFFREIFEEVLEDIALGKAIEQGRRNKFVSEDKIMDILEK